MTKKLVDEAPYHPGYEDAGFIQFPEKSEWTCYMFGNTATDNTGIVWRPYKRNVPNWFVRWMMKICFACTWVKEQK